MADKRAALLDDATKHMGAGKYGQAFSVLRQLLALDPTHVEGRRLFATVLLKLGNLLTAKSAFDSLILEAIHAKEFQQAESLLREYLGVVPRHIPFLQLLGSVYEAMHDRLSAALEYGKAVDILLVEPDHHRPDAAQQLYEKILHLAPDSLVAARLAVPMASFSPVTGLTSAMPADPPVEPPPIRTDPARPEPAVQPPSQGFRFLMASPSEQLGEPPVDDALPEEPPATGEWLAQPALEERTVQPDMAEASAQMEEQAVPADEPVAAASALPGVGDPPSAEKPTIEPAPAPPVSEPVPDVLFDAPLSDSPSATAAVAPATSPPAMTMAPPSPPADTPKASAPAIRRPAQATPGRRKPDKKRIVRTPRSTLAMGLSASMARVRAAVWSLTHTVGMLILAKFGVATLAGVVTAAAWMIMEQRPSPVYQEFIGVAAPRTLDDPKKNGYFLLLGFAAPASADPLRVGYERWRVQTGPDPDCLDDPSIKESAAWFNSPDPVARAQAAAPRLQDRLAQDAMWLGRYRKWLGLPFEDWGYGLHVGVQCPRLIAAHRLYVLEGFASDLVDGLDRLEADMGAWRAVLAHAKTLSLKLFAAEAVSDDATILSGLLARSDVDARVVGRAARLATPFTPDERSLRWAMQHELLVKRHSVEPRPRATPDALHPALGTLVERMPLPKQALLNNYAGYYEALINFTQSRTNTSPRLYEFARTPPGRWTDYVRNPIDNLLGAAPMPDWDLQRRVLLETDARLRLAGLQARLHGPSSDPSLLARIANAGSSFFDPFTDFTMLVNPTTGRLYSVGRDGRDDHGDAGRDISVPLFFKPL